jgi:hypothetical protein
MVACRYSGLGGLDDPDCSLSGLRNHRSWIAWDEKGVTGMYLSREVREGLCRRLKTVDRARRPWPTVSPPFAGLAGSLDRG